MLKTIGFPGRYIQGPGALASIGDLLDELSFNRPLVVADGTVKARVWPQLEASIIGSGRKAAFLDFPGECTRGVIAQLSAEAKELGADVIIGLGGGKTIDTSKGIARTLELPIFICPTVASSDAPTSRLIVVYDNAHRLIGVDFLRRNPDAVIVDTEIIVQAPARFFAAGIGDAISKRFEARQCLAAGGKNSFGTPPLGTALLLANAVYDLLREQGPSAYADVKVGRLTDTVEQVVEATVLISGVGFESGGLSLAHALLRGLTAIESMSAMLHGELVAFSTLVQLVVEGRSESEIAELLTLIEAVDLPMTLDQLGQVAPLSDEQCKLIAEATLGTNYSKHMTPPLTANQIVTGLLKANDVGHAWIKSAR